MSEDGLDLEALQSFCSYNHIHPFLKNNYPVLFLYRLDALDPNAYEAFKASRNLHDVVERVLKNQQESQPGMKKILSVQAALMTPVQPMLVKNSWGPQRCGFSQLQHQAL